MVVSSGAWASGGSAAGGTDATAGVPQSPTPTSTATASDLIGYEMSGDAEGLTGQHMTFVTTYVVVAHLMANASAGAELADGRR